MPPHPHPEARPRALGTAPCFIVSELQRSIDFYGKLGFHEPGVWGEPPCFAMLNRDGFDLMLSLAEDPSHVRPNGPHMVWDLYVKVGDLAAEATALRRAGVEIVRGPERAFYDMIEIEVLDPDGHRVCFSQDVGAA